MLSTDNMGDHYGFTLYTPKAAPKHTQILAPIGALQPCSQLEYPLLNMITIHTHLWGILMTQSVRCMHLKGMDCLLTPVQGPSTRAQKPQKTVHINKSNVGAHTDLPAIIQSTHSVLVNDIHDGHQLASMGSERDVGHTADLNEALEHLEQKKRAEHCSSECRAAEEEAGHLSFGQIGALQALLNKFNVKSRTYENLYI